MACSDSAFSTFHTAVEGIWLKCADCLAFLPVATASCSGVLDFATFLTNLLSRKYLHVAVGMCGKIYLGLVGLLVAFVGCVTMLVTAKLILVGLLVSVVGIIDLDTR